MEIGRIENATRVLGESQGYRPLPLRDDFFDQGDGTKMHTMVTLWEPSPEEREALANGAPLYISIIGGIFPSSTADFLCVLASKWPPIMAGVGKAPEGTGG